VSLAWTLLVTSGVSACAALGMWRLSLRLEDAGIVDVMWGYGFAVLATVAYLAAPAPGLREQLLLAAVLLWSLRLGTHLWLRCLGRDEDFRYRAMRAHHGAAFGQRSCRLRCEPADLNAAARGDLDRAAAMGASGAE